MEPARSTPVCANTASAARSDPPRDPVCDAAARLPASERPDLTAMTGFSFVVARAIRTKFFGFPKFSMYARPILVSGWTRQDVRKWARLPWGFLPRAQDLETT